MKAFIIIIFCIHIWRNIMGLIGDVNRSKDKYYSYGLILGAMILLLFDILSIVFVVLL